MLTPGISFLSGLHPTFNSGCVVGSHTGFQVTYMWNTSSWCRTLVWNPTPPPTILIWPPFQFHLLGFFSMLLFFRFLSPPSFLAPSHHSYLGKSMIFWKPFLGFVVNSRGDFGHLPQLQPWHRFRDSTWAHPGMSDIVRQLSGRGNLGFRLD